MCGISGIIKKDRNSCNIELIESLFHLQHRGQDSCGIHTTDKKKLFIIKGQGLINSVFDNNNISKLKGHIGIGHVRYPTSGLLTVNEIQPFYINRPYKISLCHNGNIYNTEYIKNYLEKNNIHIVSKSDSELLLNLFSFELECIINKCITFEDKIVMTIKKISKMLKGAYSVIMLIKNYGLIAFRDPYGIRPLVYGENENKIMIASESIALQNLHIKEVNDIKKGEIVFANNYFIKKVIYDSTKDYTPCIFEYIYISRVESIIDGVSVYKARHNMGKYLSQSIKNVISKELLDNIDFVAPIPDTSRPTAINISKIIGITYNEILIKNRYISRTFIMNNQSDRCSNIKKKFGIIKELVVGKNILLVDDSIVRGNTIRHIIKALKYFGAKKLYLAISCPVIKYNNYYGIDIPTKEELIGHKMTETEIETALGISKLIFLDKESLIQSIRDINPKLKNFELSIFDGKYVT